MLPDVAELSFLDFGRKCLNQFAAWALVAGVRNYDEVKVVFGDIGITEVVTSRPNYWRLIRENDPNLTWLHSAASNCIEKHIELGILKVPAMTDAAGASISNPTFEQFAPHLAMQLFFPILDKIEGQNGLQINDADLTNLYRLQRSLWESTSTRQVFSIPLTNFVTDVTVRIGKLLELVPFSNEEKTETFQSFGRMNVFNIRHDFGSASFKFAGDFYQDKGEGPDFGALLSEARTAITALRLMKAGDVGAFSIYYGPPIGKFNAGASIDDFRVQAFASNKYSLLSTEVPTLLALFETVQRSIFGPLQVAFRRFNQSYARRQSDDKIIDMCIALESSLLTGQKDEIKSTFAKRAATLLAQVRDPLDAYSFFRFLYDLRSAIVHEGKSLFAMKPPKIAGKMIEIGEVPVLCEESTRQVLKAYMALLSSGKSLSQINVDLDMLGISCLQSLRTGESTCS